MVKQPIMNFGPEGDDDIIADLNGEKIVYCGACRVKMENIGNNRYKCSNCGLETGG